MAPRPGIARPQRDIDFSAVGKAGRRTGITLPRQRLDEHGLEEVSHLFSSPRKPSPLKHVFTAAPIHEEANEATPKPGPSTRKTPLRSVPRSASPRKSGISGTARRSKGVDIRVNNEDNENVDVEEEEEIAYAPQSISSPSNRANRAVRRFDSTPRKTPLQDITRRNTQTPASRDRTALDKLIDYEGDIADSVEDVYGAVPLPPQEVVLSEERDDTDYPTAMGMDDEAGPVIESSVGPAIPAEFDDEEVDQTFTAEPAVINKANPRRKRKSDLEVPSSSPAVKRVRRESPPQSTKRPSPKQTTTVSQAERPKSRKLPKSKSTSTKQSANDPKDLPDVVERIRAKPNAPRNLYIMRRETPADDGVTLTRSGRTSVRPLAWWRNERCVYSDSPSGRGIADGARFPLNSIKEIIRTEEMAPPLPNRKRGKKGKGKGKARSQTADAESSDDENGFDGNAEPWETEQGTLRGPVSVWDAEHQATLADEEEEIDIAYAPAAIETQDVKSKASQSGEVGFKYAKLLGNKFMGVGLVDLPPGGVKRPKNSRKMHMSFYVVKGRVRVTVGGGMGGGDGTRFGIGEGGFWQVPRGEFCSCALISVMLTVT